MRKSEMMVQNMVNAKDINEKEGMRMIKNPILSPQ